jgi:filamin/ABP280 repeat protein
MKPVAGKGVSTQARNPGPRRSRRKIIVVVGLATLAVLYPLLRERSAAAPPDAQTDSQTDASHSDGGVDAAPRGPTPEAHGSAVKPPANQDLEVRPLFDRKERLTPGKPTKLRFSARAKSTGSPVSSADMAVSVIHPGSPNQRITAYEVEEGVYEATFTPRGPGQYRVALTSGGAPIAGPPPVKLGVVGAVGASDPKVTDITASTSYDPRTSRTKATGRGRRR